MNWNRRWIAFCEIGAIALVACAWSTRAAAGSGGGSCWSNPVNAGPPLNTPYNDMYAVLSRDDLEVYFTSNRPGTCSKSSSSCTGDMACPVDEVCSVKGGDDLWMATRPSIDSPWNTPINLRVLNSPSADSLPMLSRSEDVMWFSSDRPGGCGKSDLWQTKRDPQTGAWGAPINLGCTVNTPDDENAPAFYANDDLGVTTLYFGSTRQDPNALGGFDVYETSTADEDLYGATWTRGAHIPNISSPGRDTRTWIRRDGRELFITSDRNGGFDIWRSTREANTDTWSTPVNLGPPINTTFDEGSPSLTWDGNTLYFFSTRTDGDALGGRDIWISRRIPCP